MLCPRSTVQLKEIPSQNSHAHSFRAPSKSTCVSLFWFERAPKLHLNGAFIYTRCVQCLKGKVFLFSYDIQDRPGFFDIPERESSPGGPGRIR